MWFQGDLRFLTRKGPQREAYDRVEGRSSSFSDFSPFVFNFHRRLGKSFLSLLLLIEKCLQRPRTFAKFAAPSLVQAQDILQEHWGLIFEDCPEELYPKPYKYEKFTFRNPRWGSNPHAFSQLKLFGVNNDRGNKMRGGSTDAAALDECREMNDLEYLWGSVLLPTFKGRHEPFALMISTPPDSMDHPWTSKYIPEAMEKGRYWAVSGPDDPFWSDEEDELFAREMGGRDHPAYRREILCELVSDDSKLIIPEYCRGDVLDDQGKIRGNQYLGSRERPEAYYAFTVADMGGAGATKKSKDRCGVLFAYVDFHEQVLVIEDELFMRDLDTQSIAETWKNKAEELYDKDTEKDEGRHVARIDWWADAAPQQLVDFSSLYDLSPSAAPNTDRDAARRLLRTAFNLGRIRIHPRCENLVYQLRNGTRKPNGDWARSDKLGHCDLVSALIYMYKVADFESNPTPKEKFSKDTFFVPPQQESAGEGWNRFYRKKRKW